MSGSILAPDDELEKCQREARSGTHGPDNGDPAHRSCVISDLVYTIDNWIGKTLSISETSYEFSELTAPAMGL